MVVGGCVWLQGACMVVGGVHGCRGACVVVGGMHGCRGGVVVGGMHGYGEHAWLWEGGACVAAGGHAWLLGGACIGHDEIWSMSGRYASYWNAFLFGSLVRFNCQQLKLQEQNCVRDQTYIIYTKTTVS